MLTRVRQTQVDDAQLNAVEPGVPVQPIARTRALRTRLLEAEDLLVEGHQPVHVAGDEVGVAELRAYGHGGNLWVRASSRDSGTTLDPRLRGD